jgi:hypothetical protein
MIQLVGSDFNAGIFFGGGEWGFYRPFLRFLVFGCGGFVVKVWWIGWERWFQDGHVFWGCGFCSFLKFILEGSGNFAVRLVVQKNEQRQSQKQIPTG